MARIVSIAMYAATALAALGIHERALPNAPHGYTPTAGDCPSTRPAVRLADKLSDSESQWVQTRRKATVSAMSDFLGSLNISGFDAASYIKDKSSSIADLPNIGIACSGGGYRAMLTGAGALKAFDSREKTTTGKLGGLLQSATYVAGLSGGGWLVGSVFINNFTTISRLQAGTGLLWNLTETVFTGPQPDTTGEYIYYNALGAEVFGKKDAGFEVSITDYWGRTLANQFIDASYGGVDYTWSSIQGQPGFSTGDIPFPLVVANKRIDNQTYFPPTNTTVFEFNPYEIGSWDPETYGFVNLEYIGSNFSNGVLPSDQKCVRGYDNAGFIIGTTSSIFTSLAGTFISSQVPQQVQGALGDVVQETKNDQGFVAYYNPNPFKNWNPTGQSKDSGLNTLYLVDGGTDGQNIPFQPLIQPARAVDVIVAIDASNDIIGYPDGTAMHDTYQRSQTQAIANGTTFPQVPDNNTFVNLGLNARPTFFGCNESNTPLIVYIPNAPYTTFSNTSTFQLQYTYEQRDAIIENGALVASYGNGTANSEFRACLGCAILSRSFGRTKTKVPDACQTCFNAYCWNGTVASQTPAAPYAPALIGAAPAGKGLNVVGSETSGSPSATTATSPQASSTSSSGSSGTASRVSRASALLSALLLGSLMIGVW